MPFKEATDRLFNKKICMNCYASNPVRSTTCRNAISVEKIALNWQDDMKDEDGLSARVGRIVKDLLETISKVVGS